jgi:hypothetical protein
MPAQDFLHRRGEVVIAQLAEYAAEVIDREYKLQEFAPAYVLACQFVAADVKKWMADHQPYDHYLLLFEKGDANQDQLIGLLKQWGVDLPVEPILMEKAWVDEKGIKHFCLPFQLRFRFQGHAIGARTVKISSTVFALPALYLRERRRRAPAHESYSRHSDKSECERARFGNRHQEPTNLTAGSK